MYDFTITAHEARERVLKSFRKKLSKEAEMMLMGIFMAIKNVSDKGCCDLEYSFECRDGDPEISFEDDKLIREILMKLGFSVSEEMHDNEYVLFISWYKK